jgi:hypothetical protein
MPWSTGVVRGQVQIDGLSGAYGYVAGTSGTVSMPAFSRILGMGAYASGSGGSVTINGGASITVPTGGVILSSPYGSCISPTYVFTGTTSYFVEYVIPS